MISMTYKTWRKAGAVVALTALAACGGEAGEAGNGAESGEGEGGEASVSAPPAAAPGAAAPAAGGEAGEAGAVAAYAGLSGDQLIALRVQHLRGFVMAASKVAGDNQPDEAGVLVAQGILEVYDSAPDQFGALNIAIIRAAADPAALNRAQRIQRLRDAEDEFNRVADTLDADDAITVARMVDIATGLYQLVIQEDFVDPIEYQHSMGAALAARAALAHGEAALRAENLRAYAEARTALTRFTELWPQATAPTNPTPYREVLAQASRVRLALSPFL